MESDIEIAQSVAPQPIGEVAQKLGIGREDLMLYGKYKAKIPVQLMRKLEDRDDGKLVLVTSMTPTRAGEGKTTTTVGLTQALCRMGENALLCIREPSLGPVMGIKGGAAGGGRSQVVPMEDINLYFTGDIPAVSAANNLLSAVIDNHIFQGNELKINPNEVLWHRVTDMNDRSLRRIFIGLGDSSGLAREDRYDITAASEVMAILCLAEDIPDLKARLGRIICAYTFFGEPVTVRQLGVEGAMAALLRDAFNPNLVQTLEGGPALIHGGPFANIAHGCSSVVATKTALKLADIVVTEAGFGADLGAEKFFDIKCVQAGLRPDAVVVVATIRAIKHHGGATDYEGEDIDSLVRGWPNLERQILNVSQFGVPFVVALNRFGSDTEREVDYVLDKCAKMGVEAEVSTVHGEGGRGGQALAGAVKRIFGGGPGFTPLYDLSISIMEKIEVIAEKLYGADGVEYTEGALHDIKHLEELGLSGLPVCIAKTQKSLSDNPGLLGAPSGFNVTVKEVKASAGAGFIVVMAGDVLMMPGLPRKPSAEVIDIDDDGVISGLF